MALVACKDCGKEVSSKASVCPHCGKPRRRIRFGWVSRLLIPLLIFWIIYHLVLQRSLNQLNSMLGR